MNIIEVDIGDIKYLKTGKSRFLRRGVRFVLKLFVNGLNKLPFVPGAYFVVSANKRDHDDIK